MTMDYIDHIKRMEEMNETLMREMENRVPAAIGRTAEPVEAQKPREGITLGKLLKVRKLMEERGLA